MKNLYRSIIALLFTLMVVPAYAAGPWGFQVSQVNSKINSCAGANVNEIVYVSGANKSWFVYDSYKSNQNRLISDQSTKIRIWQSDNNLITGCTAQSSWQKYSDYAPANSWVVAMGSNCTFNKPTNKDKRNLQFVYNIGTYGVSSGNWTPNPRLVSANLSQAIAGTWTSVNLSNIGLGTFSEHSNECYNVELRYCGDGILETNNGETCDPEDATHRGWGNGGCDTNTCQPIRNPVCKSLTVNKTTGVAPTNIEATCTGYKVNTFKIDCGNGQVFTGNGNNSGNQTFKRTCNYTTSGSFTPTCFINNTITANSCQKTVNITAEKIPSIIVDKRDANVFDLDNNVGNDTQTVYRGKEAIFKIRVTNNGQEVLKDIKLIDTVETSCATKLGTVVSLEEKKFTNAKNNNVSISFGGSGNNNNSTLEIGEWFEYTCKKSNTQSNYTNTVKSIGTGITSGIVVDDSDPTVVRVIALPTPEISVDKRDANTNDLDGSIGGNDSQTVGIGDNAVFRITVENIGEEDLRNIILTDTKSLSCGSNGVVDLVSKNFKNKLNNAVVIISVSGAGNHNDNILQIGEKFTYTCTKTNTQESYTNIVDVSGIGVISGKTDTDTDPTEVILSTNPAIQVVKEDSNSNDLDGQQFNDTQTVTIGSEAVFHITVTNTGNENLKNITLTDTQAPACGTKSNSTINLANKYFTNDSDVQVVINYLTSSPGDHSDDILQVGEEFSYTCSAPNTQSNYTNIVEVGGVGIITGTTVGDEDPSVVIVRDGIYDLALRKTLSNSTPGPFVVGSTVTFDITVYNQGTVDSGIIEVTDYVPTGLTFVAGNGWTQSGSMITQNITNIVEGGNTVLTVNFTVDTNAPSSIINYAEISSDSGDDCDSTPDNDNTNDGTVVNDDIGTGCNSGGDEDDHDIEVITIGVPDPSIKIEKLDANPNLDQDAVDGNDTQTVNQGEKAVFSIRVTNDGPVSLDTIVLTDTIAPNCAGSVTLPGSYPSTWLGFTTGGTGNKTDGILESGEWFEYTCEKPNTQSGYTNTAGVSAEAVGTDTVVNDSDTSVVIENQGSSSSSSSGGSGGYTCTSASQSGSVVTCKGNSKVDSFYLKCGDQIKGPKNTSITSGQHYAEFDCSASVYQCYVYDKPDAPIVGKTWRTSAACLVSGSSSSSSSGGASHCGNGIIETNLGEQCDMGSAYNGKNDTNGNPYACSSTCKIKTINSNCENTNTCIFTWPNGGDMVFNIDTKSIIGHKTQAVIGDGEFYLENRSDYDVMYDKLCIKPTSNSSALTPGNTTGEYCANISGDVIYAYEKVYFKDYNPGTPKYEGNKDGISGLNYADVTLTPTVETNGLKYYNAYFSKDSEVNIRVAKPAVITTGGGTSYVKSSTTADVAEVAGGGNTNFVGVSATNGSNGVSSNVETLDNTDSGAIIAISGEKDVYEQAVENNSIDTSSATSGNLESYNGLSNIFIMKDANLKASDLPDLTSLGDARTYIIENGDFIIDEDIYSNKNIAFVLRNGNIQVNANVEHIDGTYIVLGTGEIRAQESDKQLVVNGSLYGNIDKLVANRYYIADDGSGQLSVGTIVSFGSSLFSRPAPLVSQFVGEYLESEKVAK